MHPIGQREANARARRQNQIARAKHAVQHVRRIVETKMSKYGEGRRQKTAGCGAIPYYCNQDDKIAHPLLIRRMPKPVFSTMRRVQTSSNASMEVCISSRPSQSQHFCRCCPPCYLENRPGNTSRGCVCHLIILVTVYGTLIESEGEPSPEAA